MDSAPVFRVMGTEWLLDKMSAASDQLSEPLYFSGGSMDRMSHHSPFGQDYQGLGSDTHCILYSEQVSPGLSHLGSC